MLWLCLLLLLFTAAGAALQLLPSAAAAAKLTLGLSKRLGLSTDTAYAA
jgi:hypothetical protein